MSYQDFVADTHHSGSTGLKKITDFCALARRRNLEWAWIDTCCIDKRSSAELSEAINSIFSWYKRATICFAFLSDLTLDSNVYSSEGEVPNSRLPKSRWFTRGWTLQELLAPRELIFFDSGLRLVGSRNSLADKISGITGIEPAYLCGAKSLQDASVAQRMYWVSTRQTTRVEDMAYCLLGLFDVNMPLLYGEGRKAFFRLQEQIIAQSKDESIFAWTSDMESAPRGMLAEWPIEFVNSGNVQPSPLTEPRPHTKMTTGTVSLAIRVQATQSWTQWMSRIPPTTLDVPLACSAQMYDGKNREISIRLQRDSPNNQVWYRSATSDLKFCPRKRYFSNFGVYMYEYTKVRVSLREADIVPDGAWTLENWPSIWRLWRVVLAVVWFELNWLYAQYLNEGLAIGPALLAFWIWSVATFGWIFCDKSFWYIALITVLVVVHSGHVVAFVPLFTCWSFFPLINLLCKAFLHRSAY